MLDISILTMWTYSEVSCLLMLSAGLHIPFPDQNMSAERLTSASGPRVIHTFMVMCHPFFVTFHAPTLDSLTLFLSFGLSGFTYPPKVDP